MFTRRPCFKLISAFLLLLTTATVLAADLATIPPQKEFAQVAAVLDRFIEHELKDKQLPAISVALVSGDRIVWARGFGYADPVKKIPATAATVYRVGSVSKLFTDIGIMQMVERGKIDLDVPIDTYLPDFKPANQFKKAITLRQLMSHRAGILREPPVGHYFDPTEPSLADTVHSMNGLDMIYEPETHVKYSNAGIAVVGYTLEKLNKQPFAPYLKHAVLKPLGLQSSAFELEPALKSRLAKAYLWTYDSRVFEAPEFQLGTSPAGNMYSTVTDLGRFITVLFREGRGPNDTVLKPETLKSMWEPQFKVGEGPRDFGIGFVVNQFEGRRMVGHSGAVYGFATELVCLPGDKLGVVAVTTMDSANAVTAHIAREALKLMIAMKEGKPLPEPAITQPIPAELVHQLEGRYGDGDKIVDLVRHGDNLYLRRQIGGYEVRLRKHGNALMVDDRLSFGPVVTPMEQAIKLGGNILPRVATPAATVLPKEWIGLIGEYGWDHNILTIIESEGKLVSLIEWYEFEPLDQIARDVFLYPARGLYDHEKVVFTRDKNGKATQVQVGGVVFKRRETGKARWDP